MKTDMEDQKFSIFNYQHSTCAASSPPGGAKGAMLPLLASPSGTGPTGAFRSAPEGSALGVQPPKAALSAERAFGKLKIGS